MYCVKYFEVFLLLVVILAGNRSLVFTFDYDYVSKLSKLVANQQTNKTNHLLRLTTCTALMFVCLIKVQNVCFIHVNDSLQASLLFRKVCWTGNIKHLNSWQYRA